jgi:hypothetical protein
MIFLGVSSALFVSGSLVLNGQQQRTEFSQGMRELNSQIQDIINDTATGYYPNNGNFNCTGGGGTAPTITTPGTTEQGANQGCIFLGRVVHFALHGTDPEQFNIYTVVGNRQTGSPPDLSEVKDYNEAKPKALEEDLASNIVNRTMPFGIKVKAMKYDNGGSPAPIGAVGFLSSFGEYSGTDLVSGAQSAIDLVPIAATNIGQPPSDVYTQVKALNNTSVKNPSSGVSICLEGGSSSQYGIITLGGGSSQRTSSTLRIVNKSPTPAECTP